MDKNVKLILGIFIFISSFVSVYYAYNEYMDKQTQLEYKPIMPVVSDYVFNEQDLNPKLLKLEKPFPSQVTGGKPFTIDSSNSDFYKTNNGYELKYIVGYDIEPGTYQVTHKGDTSVIWFELAVLDTPISFQVNEPIYNINLREGDIVSQLYWDESIDFSFEFVPQSEYVNYESGMNGIFVYGLTNHYKKIDKANRNYRVTYFYGNDGEARLNDSEILRGAIISEPGSYIVTENVDLS